MMKGILISIVSVVLACFLVSFIGFYVAVRPAKEPSSVTPAAYGIAYQPIHFKTKDGLTIRGWFIPSRKQPAKTIIILHGYLEDKGKMLASTLFLHYDYDLLYFDFRYMGESEGSYTTLGGAESEDLLAALKYLQTQNINRVGIWGFSLGGAVALMVAPEAPEIKVVVAESPYANLQQLSYQYYLVPVLRYFLGELTQFWAWLILGQDIQTISPADTAKKLKIPVLLLHSKDDEIVPFSCALVLQNSLSNNSNAKFIFNQFLKHGERYKKDDILIEEFFDENL